MKKFLISSNPAYIYSKPDYNSIPLTTTEANRKLTSILDNDVPIIRNGWYAIEAEHTIGWINNKDIID